MKKIKLRKCAHVVPNLMCPACLALIPERRTR